MDINENPLARPIQSIKGIGPKLSELFAKKGLATLEDALFFLPRTYEDRRHITPIKQLAPGQNATVLAKVVKTRSIRRGRQASLEIILADPTGEIILFWFHAYPSIQKDFETDSQMVVYGEVKFFGAFARMAHPDYERVTEFVNNKPVVSPNFGRVVPIYSETEGLNQKSIRKTVASAIRSSLEHLDDPFPEAFRRRLGLPTLKESFLAAHYPKEIPKEGALTPAIKRIIFEEFFTLQLGLGLKKKNAATFRAATLADEKFFNPFIKNLPFTLTEDQKKVLGEIKRDIAKSNPMTRLVQGDVGSGKTVVALGAAVLAAGSGYQSAFLAPTEVLAQQHFKTAERLLSPLGIRCQLLVHGMAAKKEHAESITSGRAQLIIGTHAILQEKVRFQHLGLVIVDEQHRFGVEQRSELVKRGGGVYPHLLMMTATPIPRTLAFTVYGDLDLSVIRQKPVGRKSVLTKIIRDRERPKLYQRIRESVNRNEQVYIIYPLVEQSEKLDLKSATQMFEKLSKEVFPQFSIALLHGRMKGEEKDRILKEFKDHKYSVLVSTTVIEVGIDVPNATLMVIEHPERLGLSQLHQLRGRVGRGAAQSECLLVADAFITPRLRVMENTDDGFEIAEEDLKIRGPGEFLGTRQSGLPGFRVGHLLRDAELLTLAREEAFSILKKDPSLLLPEHGGIRKMVESRWKEKIELLKSV
jgi:ATP-dependent DNA helicase RecG